MNDYPENFIEFMDRFRTDQECRKYFLSVKCENGFICTTCGHTKYWTNDDSRYLICQSCRHRVSLLAGTVMQDSKPSVRVWLASMWLFATQKDGISAKSLQENLGLRSYKSAWSLLHKLRIALV